MALKIIVFALFCQRKRKLKKIPKDFFFIFIFSGPHMPIGIICSGITPARGNHEHRPLSGAVTNVQ